MKHSFVFLWALGVDDEDDDDDEMMNELEREAALLLRQSHPQANSEVQSASLSSTPRQDSGVASELNNF